MRGSPKSERGLLVVLAVWSLLPLAVIFIAPPDGLSPLNGVGRFTGSDGIQVGDHMQYIAWIRDAGTHVLFSNQFDVVDDPHLFLHPMWLLSGAAWRAGASLQLAFLLWKPVGVAVVFAGFAAYVRRMAGESATARAATLALALFFFAPVAWLSDWAGLGSPDLRFGSLTMALELFPAGLLWGVLPTAIALGLMPLFLLGIERILEPGRRPGGRSPRRHLAMTALAGAFTSWLHPWQGLILLAIVAGLVAWGRFSRLYLVLAAPVAATAAPLLYYSLLSHTDSAWGTVSQPNHMPHFGAWLFLAAGTAVLVALPGVSRPAGDLQERALLLWPVASVLVYLSLHSSFFYHALAGLTLPLAVLAVRGARRWRVPAAVAIAASLVVTLPGMAFAVDLLTRDETLRVLRPGEAAALDYVEHQRRPGAVLAPVRLGRTVPAFTGRSTWVGHPTWTPANAVREKRAEALFSDQLDAAGADALVAEARASYLISDCEHPGSLTTVLGARIASVHRFGCATVYSMRQGPG